MRAGFDGLVKSGIVLLGVSLDSVESHREFAAKHDLPFRLLSDEQRAIATAYEVLNEITYLGETFEAARRRTFLIDEQGVIIKVVEDVEVDDHANQILRGFDAR